MKSAVAIQSAREIFHDKPERSWVPFMDNRSGDYLCIVPKHSGGESVCSCWHDWDDRSGSGGILDWLSELVKSMENGEYEYC